MRNVTRLLSVVLVTLMIMALAACGGTPAATTQGAPNTEAKADESAKTDDTGEPAPSAAAGGKAALLTWTNPGTVKWLNGLAARLLDATGVTLEISDIDTNNHVQTRQTRLMANDIDIITYEGGFLNPQEEWNAAMYEMPDWQKYVEAGLFLDITDEPFMENWDLELMTNAYGYKGRIYGLMGGSIPLNGVFYNIDRFNELGLEIPQTWDDFIALCEAIKAAGHQPITNGGGDQWPLNMFAGLVATNYLMDEDGAIGRALFLGEKKFTDPDIVELYKAREQFASYMEPGVTGVPYSDVYGRFATEKALMLADGSWAAGDVEAANPSFEYSYFPLPGKTVRDDGLIHQMGAKFDFAMVIATDSPNKEAALKVFEFFSSKEEYPNFVEEVGFYPAQPNVQYNNEFLKSMEPYMEKARGNFTILTPKGTGEYGGNGGCNMFLLSVLGGPFSAEQLADEAQKDWDAARAANAAQ